MKKFLLIVVALIFTLQAYTGTVTPETAKLVAVNFYLERKPCINPVNLTIPEVLTIEARPIDVPLYYVCKIDQGGFVIVSAIDNVVPVLAYSFEDDLDVNNRPCGFDSWMSHYESQIAYARFSGISATPEISSQWTRLTSVQRNSDSRNIASLSVSPLLVSKWNQGTPYNLMCPADAAGPGGHCYAGCVATAMGQLLYYYRHPEQGTGSYAYYHPDYDSISADFGASQYDWDAMPSSLMRENQAVAQLLFHLGVSVDMDYGPDGSGMWNHKAAYSLKTYFKYGPETQYYFRDSTTLDWDSILIANLNQNKPLYYAGWAGVNSNSGHAFVCDGYQGTDYFHFNWGWGGSYDGYFYIDNLTPGGSNFNYAQEVIPMFPDTINSTYPDYCAGNDTLQSIDGSVEDGSGWFQYQPNASCSWLIKPNDTEHDSVSSIKLNFNYLDNAQGDTVKIYDGETTNAALLRTLTGNTMPGEITSTGNNMLVTFSGDATDELDGWIADYRSTLPVYCSGQTTLSGQSGVFSDGSGNKRYNNNSSCKWKIQPEGAGSLTLWFNEFSLADTLDKIVITNLVTHEQIAVYKGNDIPDIITAPGGKILVLFSTNSTGTGDGWEAEYNSSMVGVTTLTNQEPNAVIIPNPAGDRAQLLFNCDQQEQVNIELRSLTGQLLKRWEIISKCGNNRLDIEAKDLSPAMYFVRICAENESKTLRLIVNHAY